MLTHPSAQHALKRPRRTAALFNKTAGVNAIIGDGVAGTNDIQVNTGATLRLTAANQIADNATVADRYLHDYSKRPEHLSYGLTVRDTPVHCGELEKWGLRPNEYFLYVSRLTPENEAELLLRAYRLLENPLPLVLVGADPYEHAYRRLLGELATDRVIFTGLRFADAYIELSQNARAFVMPATIEATRLVLLDQLGMGKCIIYHDCAATREVLADTGIPFDTEHPIENLAAKLSWAQENPVPVAAEGRRIRQRAELFRWETVLTRYEEIFTDILTK